MKDKNNLFFSSVINKSVLTLSKCIKFKLKNGYTFGFTTNNNSVNFLEEPYITYKTSGFVPSATQYNNMLQISNLQVNLLIDNEIIKFEDLEKNLFDDAEVWIFEFDFLNKPYSLSKINKEIYGKIGNVTRKGMTFECDFNNLIYNYQNNLTSTVKPSCSNKFGDSRCKFDLNQNGFYFEDTINYVKDNQNFNLEITNKIDGYFENGTIEFTSGNAKGEKITIKNSYNLNNNIIVQLPFIGNIQTGDTCIINKGCNKTHNQCVEYNNSNNFNGFPMLPKRKFVNNDGADVDWITKVFGANK